MSEPSDPAAVRSAVERLRYNAAPFEDGDDCFMNAGDVRLVLDALEERMAPLPRETAICFHQADGNSTAIPTCRHCGAPMTEGAGSTYIPPPPSRDLGSSAFDPHILEKP